MIDKKDEKNLIDEFFKEHLNESNSDNNEFIKYVELFENRFGRCPKGREPGGSVEQIIQAIKVCLEEDEDILDELIFENDILDLRSFYAKRINNYEELEKFLLKSVIYYIFAVRNEKEFNLDAIFRILSYKRDFFRHYIKELPDDHLARNNFEKVEYLSDEEYINIANAIKEKIAELMSIYYDEKLYCFEKLIESEEDAERYVGQILEDKIKEFLY